MKVLKFGGGCLLDADGFRRAARLTLDNSGRVAVVVSAVNGLTDELIRAGEAAAAGTLDAGFIGGVRERHVELAMAAIGEETIRSGVRRVLDGMCGRLERLFGGIALVGEISPSVRAHVVSYGERMAAHLLTGVLRGAGGKAKAFETDHAGIVAVGGFDGASVDWPGSSAGFAAVKRDIENGVLIPVFTGYFGRSPEGRVVTFGRNGSDYSAAVVALGLGAETLELWKDTDGIMTADPKLVPEARPVLRMSAAAAAELSYFGAKILHPSVFEPLAGASVAIHIRTFADPESPGTEIVSGESFPRPAVHCVTANPEVAVLRVLGPGVGVRPGIIGRVGDRLAAAGINILTVLTSQTAINLLVDRSQAVRGKDELMKIGEDAIRTVALTEDAAIVAVVGERLDAMRGVAGRFFAALDGAAVRSAIVASGASEAAIYAVVPRGDAALAVRALHEEFFSGREFRDPETAEFPDSGAGRPQ